jgi:hypothetical protein
MDRNVQPLLVDLAVGLAAGLFAKWATDRAQGPLRRATPEGVRRREAQVAEPQGDAVLDEIGDFVETAKREAGGEEVVARLAARDGGVELAVLTRSGRELDRRVFGLEDSSLTAADVARVVEGSVPVVDGTG